MHNNPSMTTTNTNNGSGGRKNHHLLSSSSWSWQDVTPSLKVYYNGASADDQTTTHHGKDHTFPIVLGVIAAVLLLLWWVYYDCQTDVEELQPEAAAGGHLPPLAGGLVDRPVAPTSTAVELAPVVEPPVLCTTYRKGDGWPGEAESSCGVCLADLADGEAMRVLPACMHYFHAVCVNEWLRAHATCPLCRATIVAPADNT